MRILFIYRHYWPDTPPYAAMLRSMAGHLVAAGHEVSVWCEKPAYARGAPDAPSNENMDGVSVTRVKSLPLWRHARALGTLGMLLFPPRMLMRAVLMRVSGKTCDLVVTATMPPVINGLFALAAARLFKARLIYHCQDIYPELGAMIGLWNPDGWFFRLLVRLDLLTCRGAQHAVVLCEDMRATLIARGLPPRRISIVNNFMVQDIAGSSAPNIAATESYKVIFAGNMGRFQKLETVLCAAEKLQDTPAIEFLFLGGGAEFENLRQRFSTLPNVRFAHSVPVQQAQPIIAAASLGIVSLKPGLVRFAYPSKTLTYLALGVPVLAVVEHDCELARMIESEGVGFVSSTGDSADVADTIRHAYEDRRNTGAMRNRARELYASRFSRAKTLRRWESLVTETACRT